MSDWPKKMWAGKDTDGIWHAEEETTEPDCMPAELEVLVYPADQAPEPVAWRFHIDSYGKQVWCYQDSGVPEIPCQALYLAPPAESAIRASERERCAKVCEAIALEWSPDGRRSQSVAEPADGCDECAAAIRELGDE